MYHHDGDDMSLRYLVPGGIMREIMLVPLPLASSRDLMSFLTFQISTFLSACSAVSLILPALYKDGQVELKLILKQKETAGVEVVVRVTIYHITSCARNKVKVKSGLIME